MTGLPRTRTAPASALSDSTRRSSLPTRPPAQVYTRGTTGAVRTPQEQRHNAETTSRSNNTNHRGGSQSTSSREDHPLNVAAHRRQRSTGQGSIAYTTSYGGNSRDGGLSNHGSNHSVNTPNSLDDHTDCVSTIGSRSGISGGITKQQPFSGDSKSKTTTSSRDDSVISSEIAKAHVKVARRVIEDLNRAQGAAERRIAAVTNACEILDHSDEIKHNVELYHGAATSLAKLLTASQNDNEIRMILAATEMVYRGSPKAVTASFRKMNGTLFLQHVLRLLDRFETRNVQHAEISILNISRILHSFSRSSELRAAMVRQSGMLVSLSRVSTRVLNPECRLTRVRIIANLSNCEENKVLMYEQEGMLAAVLRIGHFDSTAAARQYAATALMEFSSAPANKVSMARNETVLGTLVKVVLVEKCATTRESAITALQNLAFTKENRTILVSFRNGMVLDALKKALAADLDVKARRRSAGALTNLACDETAAVMGNHKGLLDALAIVATKDENMDVQTRASLALTKIASSITVHMECHAALLDALVVASLSKASNSVTAVLRVKARSPENRETLARHPGVIDTLADICVSESAKTNDRDNSIRALMHLVNEDENRKIMCNTTVLTAVVTAGNYKDPDLDEARDSSIRAMERMATEVSNRPVMAHHEGLIVTVSKAVEREARWEQEGRDAEYGYLAKPLLMSLLVSM